MKILLLSLVVGGVILASFRGTDSLEDTSSNINNDECMRSVKSALYSLISNDLRNKITEELTNFEDANIKAISPKAKFGFSFNSLTNSLKKSVKSVKSSIFGSKFDENANNLEKYKSRCKNDFNKIDGLEFKIEIKNDFKIWSFTINEKKYKISKILEFHHQYFELITMNEIDIFLLKNTKEIFNEIFPKISFDDDSKASQK